MSATLLRVRLFNADKLVHLVPQFEDRTLCGEKDVMESAGLHNPVLVCTWCKKEAYRSYPNFTLR